MYKTYDLYRPPILCDGCGAWKNGSGAGFCTICKICPRVEMVVVGKSDGGWLSGLGLGIVRRAVCAFCTFCAIVKERSADRPGFSADKDAW